MVIHQFNKLIRNKWLWGAFAVIVGGAFAFDFLVDDLLRDGRGDGDRRASVVFFFLHTPPEVPDVLLGKLFTRSGFGQK